MKFSTVVSFINTITLHKDLLNYEVVVEVSDWSTTNKATVEEIKIDHDNEHIVIVTGNEIE